MHTFQTLFFVISVLLQTGGVHCHGRLWEPPSRSSMWRQGYNTSVNINDNELNCGGFKNQWISYGGLCGTCGDPFQQRPRENEVGGKYASGLITRLYRSGETIPITIDLTANHGGYFEFRLCPVEKRRVRATQECLDKYPLVIANQPEPGIKYWIQDRGIQGHVTLKVKLPPLLSCKHCVLQWRWWTASRWGCEADVCGNGQGPQEEFYGCSDIAIAPPRQYATYLPLITLPTGSNPVTYDVAGGSNTDHKHVHLHDGHMQVVLNEFSDSVRGSVRSKHSGSSFQGTNNIPEAKVFFKSHEVLDSPAIKTNLADALQRIMVDTIMKYNKPNGKNVRVIVSDKECFPTARFSDNPIILEWCTRGCPGLNRECPPNMCSCKPKFTQNSEALMPFMDLVQYRSELMNKVPFELTNSFSSSKMYDSLFGNNVNEGNLFGNFGTDNRNLFRNSYSKHTELTNRFKNGQSDIWKIWNNNPYNERVTQHDEEFIRFPIKPRSMSQIYKIPIRAFSRTSDSHAPDIKPAARFPLEMTNKPPVVKGLTFFSNDKPHRSERPSMFVQESAEKYIASPSVRRELIPFRLTARREFLPNKSQVMPRKIRCSASTIFGHVSSMIKWCQKNCSFGFCPPSVCKCY